MSVPSFSCTFGCLSAILLLVITHVTLGLGEQIQMTTCMVGNVPVKLQNIIPNKGVPSTLQFAPYDNTLLAGERTNSVAPFQIYKQNGLGFIGFVGGTKM